MTADDAREELEAAIWGTDPASLGAVRAVLAAADKYATAAAAEACICTWTWQHYRWHLINSFLGCPWHGRGT